MLRRPPMYELRPRDYAFASLAGDATGLVLGLVGGLLFPPSGNLGFFGLFIALLAGSGAGSAVAEAITRATSGKRGIAMQLIAVASLVLAAAVRLAVSGDFELVTRDLLGGFMLVVAGAVAWGRLR